MYIHGVLELKREGDPDIFKEYYKSGEKDQGLFILGIFKED